MKDAARLAGYFMAIVLTGALLAPPLYWGAQALAAHGITFLSGYDFERFFHRALLVAAIAWAWPFLRSLSVRTKTDLQLAPNQRWKRDLFAGLALAAIPLLCCGAVLIATNVYAFRRTIPWPAVARLLMTVAIVPLIEEVFFRGLILGVLLKVGRILSILATSALFSILHFLKAPESTNAVVTWNSGFNSIANSFAQFGQPMLLLAGFTTLFLVGVILADARIQTRSLWLAIGLHAGWIFASGEFNKVARRKIIALPWLGENLLIGIVPLAVLLLTWLLVRAYLKYVDPRKVKNP